MTANTRYTPKPRNASRITIADTTSVSALVTAVHLIHAELQDELRRTGFTVAAGDLGENVTTRGTDLLGLPTGTRLHLGETAIVELTGLRKPCVQLDGFESGLLAAVLDRDASGNVVRKSGVMGVVLAGGEISPGDSIRVDLPPEPHSPLERV